MSAQVQDRVIERILSTNPITLSNEIHEKETAGTLDAVGEQLANVFKQMAANGITLNRQNLFEAAGGKITEGYGNFAVPAELQQRIADIGDSDYLEESTQYGGNKFAQNSKIYEIENSESHPLFKRDKYTDWRIFAEMIGTKDDKNCELLGIHVRCNYKEITQSTMINNAAKSFIAGNSYAIHLPPKKYDATLKRLVIDEAAMKQYKVYNAAAIFIMLMMEVEGAQVLDDEDRKPYGNIFTYSIGTFLSQADLTISTEDFIGLVATNLRGMCDTSECIYYMNLINKIVTDARDLVTRIYSFVETSIRKSGYKFKSYAVNKGVVRTTTGNWYENFDPYKSKAYRELGVTRSRTKKGVNPYPSFHKLDIISYLHIAPESLNVLHSIKVKKYYINKSGIEAYNKVAGDIRQKMFSESYVDVGNLYKLASTHGALIYAIRTSGETGFGQWIAERNIQLPILVITSNDLYVMKSVNEPSFVPLGYRSINALQEVVLYSPIDNSFATLPSEYYNVIYKLKRDENIRTETTAKEVVSELLKYTKQIAVSSPISNGDYRNRKTYNRDKEIPTFNTNSAIMHKGITRYAPGTKMPREAPDEPGNGGMNLVEQRRPPRIEQRGQEIF